MHANPPAFPLDLRDAVVAITGASAGVGRATARRFAQAGANVALLGRDASALETTRAEVASVGGRVAAFPVDVADADAVLAAARRIEAELGPIQVWVNNAMVTVFGMVRDLAPEEVRRVTEVTYLGCVHGTMAALSVMRERDRGVVVQVGSSLAYRGIPLQAAYCGAKHAIRGFTDALRTELRHAGSGIAVTMVHLPALDTPQFEWARTKRAKQPRPVAPVYAPMVAAAAIVRAARRPVPEYWVGRSTVGTILANMIAPGLVDGLLARMAVAGQDRSADVRPGRLDNLFEPVPGLHRTDGAFGGESRSDAITVTGSAGRGAALAAGCIVVGLVGFAVGARFGARTVGARWPARFRG